MKHRVKNGILPPGGWHYIQPLSGGRSLRVKAGNFEALVQGVLQARLENDIAPGDVDTEVEAYICGLSKGQCYPETKAVQARVTAAAAQPRPPGMKERWVDLILSWVNRASRSRTGMGGLVAANVAEDRARQCAHCPLNLRWQNSCPTCVTHTRHAALRLRQGNSVRTKATIDRIGGCRHHRWDCETAAFFAEPESGKLEGETNPVTGCWAERIKSE